MADGTRPRSNTCSQTTYKIHHPPLVLKTLRLPSTKPAGSCDATCRLPIVSTTVDAHEVQAVRTFAGETEPSSPEVLPPSAAQIVERNDQEHEDAAQRSISQACFEMVDTRLPTTPRERRITTPPNDSTTPRTGLRYAPPASPIPRSPHEAKTPPRQDSSYYSTQGDSDSEDVVVVGNSRVRRSRAKHQVSIQRERVLRTRRTIRERRGRLSKLRENFRNAADLFMRRTNETVAFDSIREELSPDHNKLREAQDALGVAENEYDTLEIQLEQAERQLDYEERYFYDTQDVSSSSVEGSELSANISPFLTPNNQRATESPTSDFGRDVVQEYLEKMAEAHYTREDLDELEDDFYHFSTDANFRDRHDVLLSAEATSFLAEFSERRAEIVQDLRDIEAEMWRLREHCLREGLFTEDEHVYKPRDALVEDVMDLVHEAEDRSPLRVAAYKIPSIYPNVNFEDKREFVNHWLLQWIQDSTYECSLLKAWIYTTYLERFGNEKELANDHWSHLALQNWNTDAAGAHADALNSASMLDVIAGDRRVNASIGMSDFSGSWRSSDIDLDDIPMLESPLTGSDAGSGATNKPTVSAKVVKHRRPLNL